MREFLNPGFAPGLEYANRLPTKSDTEIREGTMILKKTQLLAVGLLTVATLAGCAGTENEMAKSPEKDAAAETAAAEQATADRLAAEKAAADEVAANVEAAARAAEEKAAAEAAAAVAQQAAAEQAAADAEAARLAADAAAAVADAQGGPIEIRIRLEKGQQFAFRQTMEMNQDMDMGGMQISTIIGMTSDYAYTVTDVTESGDMQVAVKFGQIKGSFENPMVGSLEFDSEKEAEESGNPMIDMMASMFTANAGQEIGITMTPNGEITDVTGVDALVERLLENNPMAGAMGGAMDAETMSESMKQMIGGQLGALPSEAISVGDSWKVERAMGQMGMDVAMTIDNTLASVSATELVVDSEITATLSGGQMAQMITVDEFTGTSTTTYSRNDGLVLLSTAKMNMTASMDTGQGAGGMTMVIETKTERLPAE